MVEGEEGPGDEYIQRIRVLSQESGDRVGY